MQRLTTSFGRWQASQVQDRWFRTSWNSFPIGGGGGAFTVPRSRTIGGEQARARFHSAGGVRGPAAPGAALTYLERIGLGRQVRHHLRLPHAIAQEPHRQILDERVVRQRFGRGAARADPLLDDIASERTVRPQPGTATAAPAACTVVGTRPHPPATAGSGPIPYSCATHWGWHSSLPPLRVMWMCMSTASRHSVASSICRSWNRDWRSDGAPSVNQVRATTGRQNPADVARCQPSADPSTPPPPRCGAGWTVPCAPPAEARGPP